MFVRGENGREGELRTQGSKSRLQGQEGVRAGNIISDLKLGIQSSVAEKRGPLDVTDTRDLTLTAAHSVTRHEEPGRIFGHQKQQQMGNRMAFSI